jgi:hypothetical protein
MVEDLCARALSPAEAREKLGLKVHA